MAAPTQITTWIFRSSWSCPWVRRLSPRHSAGALKYFHTLKGVLKKRGYNTSVGDEGGFAPSLKSNVEAIELVIEAIQAGRLQPGEQIAIALDPAASELYSGRQVCLQEVGQVGECRRKRW